MTLVAILNQQISYDGSIVSLRRGADDKVNQQFLEVEVILTNMRNITIHLGCFGRKANYESTTI